MTNYIKFENALAATYHDLFKNDPEYAYSATKTTPEALALKITAGLSTNTANKDGNGVKRTCKALGIPHTYKAIGAFLKE